MKKVRVFVTDEARRARKEINAWWKRNRRKNPELFKRELAAALAKLRTAPGMGSPYGEDGARRVIMTKTQYEIAYLHDPTTGKLFVLTICSTLRDR